MTTPLAMRFEVPGAGEVSALWLTPDSARAAYVFAHGAGAGMTHAFKENAAQRFAANGIATLRYQFPYSERGSGRIDPQPVLLAAVRAAVAAARELAPDLPTIAGGKSMGGRMTTLAAAAQPLAGVRGIALVGFPLHAAGKAPNVTRAEHLANVTVPMLFLQGTRDTLADLELMRGVCAQLGPRATLHVVDGADHSFGVLKRSGRTSNEVLEELATTLAQWSGALQPLEGERP